MNKIMIALMCMMGCSIAMATDNVVTNVYDFKASLKVPYLDSGVRTYKSQTLKGYLFSETTDGQISAMWLEVQNNKTKVIHVTEFGRGFYNLMGKSNKTSERTTPSIYFTAEDVEVIATEADAHEFISEIQFAGTGTLKSLKTVTKGCSTCGEPTSSTEYCNLLWKMNGNCTGVMDCQCPDEEDGWWHTVVTTLCGVFHDSDGDIERSHYAATWGTWSATFNKKLSGTIVK